MTSGSTPYCATRCSAKRVMSSAVVYSRAWMAAVEMSLGLGPGTAEFVSLRTIMS